MWNKTKALNHQKELFEKALGVLQSKRVDYCGDTDPFANFRQSNNWGVEPWKGAAIRLSDKLSRFYRLSDKGGVGAVDENIEDTIVDAINYLCIAYQLWLESQVVPEDTTAAVSFTKLLPESQPV